MDDLRNASEEEQNILRHRWIWELIQNASDCMGENEVIVYIEHGENQLTFSHNGVPFAFSNLIDLITQISSKRGSDEKIRKFGTGFIATHLISEIVTIQGIYHQDDDSNEYKKLDFEIDRSGKTEEVVKESVKSSLQFMIDFYPELYPTRKHCLNHLFCSIGNGYGWWKGELVN